MRSRMVQLPTARMAFSTSHGKPHVRSLGKAHKKCREAMKVVLGSPSALVGLQTLGTVFAEVTSILNIRPICPSSDNPNDLEPLTPNHLLLQR